MGVSWPGPGNPRGAAKWSLNSAWLPLPPHLALGPGGTHWPRPNPSCHTHGEHWDPRCLLVPPPPFCSPFHSRPGLGGCWLLPNFTPTDQGEDAAWADPQQPRAKAACPTQRGGPTGSQSVCRHECTLDGAPLLCEQICLLASNTGAWDTGVTPMPAAPSQHLRAHHSCASCPVPAPKGPPSGC